MSHVKTTHHTIQLTKAAIRRLVESQEDIRVPERYSITLPYDYDAGHIIISWTEGDEDE